MSPIESTGASALARGSPFSAHSGFAARSGSEKAKSIQGHATAAAVAPVETAKAVAQTQSAQKSRVRIEQRPAPDATATQAAQSSARSKSPPSTKPMTAVLLHELRLQQELAHVQEEKEKKHP